MNSTRKYTAVGLFLVAIGILLRVRQVGINSSLWLDEASVAVNILSRSFAGLIQPLDYAQAAPIFFLWIEKLFVVTFHSSSEFVLRLPPLLEGSVACAGVWLLCRQLKLSTAATLCSTALFSLAPLIIDYSSQAKQYSGDVLTAVAIYLAASLFFAKPAWRSAGVFMLAGLLGMGLAHSSIFVLAGVGITGLLDGWRRNDRQRLVLQASVIGVWLLGFAFDFFLFLRHPGEIPGMVAYWDRAYTAFMPISLHAPAWMLKASLDAAGITGFQPALLLIVAIAGAIVLWRMDWRITAMFFLPVALAMLASALRQYPFADRMTLFASPALLICTGTSIGSLFTLSNRPLQIVALAILCVLSFAPSKRAVGLFLHPEYFRKEEFRDVFLNAVATGRCSDHIIVYERAGSHYRYYNRFRWSGKYPAPILGASEIRNGLAGLAIRSGDALPKESFQEPLFPSGDSCFWLVFAHTGAAEEAALSASLDSHGYKQKENLHLPGASARLFTY